MTFHKLKSAPRPVTRMKLSTYFIIRMFVGSAGGSPPLTRRNGCPSACCRLCLDKPPMMAWSHETSAEKGMKIVISSAKLRRVHGFWWLNVIHEILYGGYPPIKRGRNITHLDMIFPNETSMSWKVCMGFKLIATFEDNGGSNMNY